MGLAESEALAVAVSELGFECSFLSGVQEVLSLSSSGFFGSSDDHDLL